MTVVYQPALPWQSSRRDATHGQCLAGVFDLAGGMAAGRRALAEALARMTITGRGTNIVDREYGYDLLDTLNGRLRAEDLSQASAELTAQFRRDDRVQDAQVRVEYFGGVLIVAATIFDGAGPFPLTLSVNDAGVQLLKAGV